MPGFSCQAVLIGGHFLVYWQPPMLPGGSILLWGRKGEVLFFQLFATNIFTMSGPHYISEPKRRVITGHAATDYLSPDDVKEFRNEILDAGLGFGTLLAAEYPRTELVSEAL